MRACVDLIVGLALALLVLTILSDATGRLSGSPALLLALIVVVSATALRARRRARHRLRV